MSLVNVSFMVLASILVLFMTPGLAFFYGGLVSKRNVVNTMLSVFVMTGVAIMLWILIGYSLSFVGDHGGVFGSFAHPFLSHLNLNTLTSTHIPTSLYSLFQMMFAIITPALLWVRSAGFGSSFVTFSGLVTYTQCTWSGSPSLLDR